MKQSIASCTSGYIYKSLLPAVVVAVFLLFPTQALACGWWGDGESSESTEGIMVGVDGLPVEDSDERMSEVEAHTLLGDRYRKGEIYVQDYAEAVKWYLKAAEKGFSGAQNNLAAMYEQGLGVKKDDSEAARWYLKAAGHGERHAQHSVGVMYRDGRGLPQDFQKAAAWLMKAARGGHLMAQGEVADMLWKGQGVGRDKVRAYKWWRVAAMLGDANSKKSYDRAAKEMTPAEIDKAERLAWKWMNE